MPWWLHNGLVLALLGIVVWRLLVPALQEEKFGIAFAEGGLITQDFSMILVYVKAFWTGEPGYNSANYLRITSEWAGHPVHYTQPFGYTPTILWVLAPLCFLPTAWAYAVWTLCGIGAVWWMTRSRWAIWLAAVFFTPVAYSCFALGQTAILTVPGLLFLMWSDCTEHPSNPSGAQESSHWSGAMVLWALTAKAPVALTAAVPLLIRHRWRTCILAGGLTLLTTASVTYVLGSNWIGEYINQMTHYDLQTADPVVASSIAPQAMNNMRALLHLTFGMADHSASRLSGTLWLLALGMTVAAAFTGALADRAVWGFSILAYLIFCPHVTSTEDIQLVLILAVFTDPMQRVAPAVRWVAVALVMTVLYLPAGLWYQGALRLPAVVAAKLGLAGLVWAQRPHQERSSKSAADV